MGLGGGVDLEVESSMESMISIEKSGLSLQESESLGLGDCRKLKMVKFGDVI